MQDWKCMHLINKPIDQLIPYVNNARTHSKEQKYVDAIIKRWQKYTGKNATLESNRKTYNELMQ